jgi:signal transduction histidine kinase
MKWFLKRKFIATGFSLAILVLGIVNTISYQNTTNLFKNQKQVENSYETLQKVRDVLTTLRDAERARRGYIITGNDAYLETYNNSIKNIDGKFKEAQRATIDNPIQQQRLNLIQPLIVERVDLIKESIKVYKQNKFDSRKQIILTDRGILLHDQIWRVIADMEREEQLLLQRRQIESQASFQFTIIAEIIGSCFGFALLFAIYYLLQWQIYHRQRVEEIEKDLKKEIELNELKIRFFSMVSHEFRTPLSTILISAQVLENSTKEWSEAKKIKNLRRIQSSAKTMTQLLSDILTLSRAEAGKLEFKPQLLDLEEFCEALIEDIKFSSSAQQEILFINQCPQTMVLLDEKMLRSIITNLLANAIKYSSPQSDIYFLLSCEFGQIIFEIQDQGIGIPIDEQQQLYLAFHRGTNVGNVAGTGLGLAVVKTCVELHGGSINVESRVGVGTKFTVKIPWEK